MKPGYLSSSPLVVHDPRAARFVADAKASRFLEPFMGRERTASAVAAELGVNVSSVLYRIDQLLDLGLLQVARTEPRRGRAVKHYRAVADEFFVPFELTDAETLGALGSRSAGELKHLLETSLGAAYEAIGRTFEGGGVRLMRDQKGRIDRTLAHEAAAAEATSFPELALTARAPALWDQHCTLDLTEAEAKALQRELSEVFGRYYRRAGGDRRPYIVRLALAPIRRG